MRSRRSFALQWQSHHPSQDNWDQSIYLYRNRHLLRRKFTKLRPSVFLVFSPYTARMSCLARPTSINHRIPEFFARFYIRCQGPSCIGLWFPQTCEQSTDSNYATTSISPSSTFSSVQTHFRILDAWLCWATSLSSAIVDWCTVGEVVESKTRILSSSQTTLEVTS